MSHKASVQSVHVGIEAIEDGIICLSGSQFRAVLEVGSINFGLQGELEQEAVLAGYAAWLNGLAFPVQVLIRVIPVDLEASLSRLEWQARAEPVGQLALLAQEHAGFLRQIARNRTLLDRRFYLIVPAEEARIFRGPFLPSLHRGRHRPQQASRGIEAARKQLTFRCEEMERQLERCGLPARRLADIELAQLFHACWSPELSRVQRVRRALDEYTALVVRGDRSWRRERSL